jgi:DNA repair protein RecO (recombination protein O)
MRVFHQPGFVLLNRPYSESSFISELFTRDYGRLAVIAKGARRLKSPFRGSLQPFVPLLLSWTGKGEVPTLTAAEFDRNGNGAVDAELEAEALICGFYCNELITYLLHRHDPHPSLFDAYCEALQRLYRSAESGLAAELRDFERVVIRETGYEVNFVRECDQKTAIVEDRSYVYDPVEGGFRACDEQHPRAVAGKVILGLSEKPGSHLSAEQMSQGKQLMRAILNHSLGHKSIHSRELFIRSLGS